MEIGLSTASFFGKAVLEDTFNLIRDCGVHTAEVFMTTLSEYTAVFGDILAERAAGITVHSIHTLNSQFEPQLFHTAERTRRDAEAIFRMALANGKKLGARFYTFHGVARLKRHEYVFDYPVLGARMCELIEEAGEYGISMSYENVHWAYYYQNGFYENLKKYCPRLRGTLDIKQAFQSHIDYKLFLREMGRDISTVHVCDYLENGKTTTIGRGIFDFKELFHLLREEGVQAPVLVELYAGDYRDFSEVAECVQYLRSLQ